MTKRPCAQCGCTGYAERVSCTGCTSVGCDACVSGGLCDGCVSTAAVVPDVVEEAPRRRGPGPRIPRPSDVQPNAALTSVARAHLQARGFRTLNQVFPRSPVRSSDMTAEEAASSPLFTPAGSFFVWNREEMNREAQQHIRGIPAEVVRDEEEWVPTRAQRTFRDIAAQDPEMRAHGDPPTGNPEFVTHTHGEVPPDLWGSYAGGWASGPSSSPIDDLREQIERLRSVGVPEPTVTMGPAMYQALTERAHAPPVTIGWTAAVEVDPFQAALDAINRVLRDTGDLPRGVVFRMDHPTYVRLSEGDNPHVTLHEDGRLTISGARGTVDARWHVGPDGPNLINTEHRAQITFSRLPSGEWGVRVRVSDQDIASGARLMCAGDEAVVYRRDGTTSRVVLGESLGRNRDEARNLTDERFLIDRSNRRSRSRAPR